MILPLCKVSTWLYQCSCWFCGRVAICDAHAKPVVNFAWALWKVWSADTQLLIQDTSLHLIFSYWILKHPWPLIIFCVYLFFWPSSALLFLISTTVLSLCPTSFAAPVARSRAVCLAVFVNQPFNPGNNTCRLALIPSTITMILSSKCLIMLFSSMALSD